MANFRSQALIKNGKQSAGNLFLSNEVCIKSMKKIILKKIEEYREKFNNSDDAFIKNWPKDYELYGWIISLKSGGSLSSANLSGAILCRTIMPNGFTDNSGC